MINLEFQKHDNFNEIVTKMKDSFARLGFNYSCDDTYSTVYFIKEDLTLIIFCFLANKGNQYCYSAVLKSSLNNKSVELPYSADRFGNPKKTYWRMYLYKLIEDIPRMIENIRSIDQYGFMKAKIYYWNKERGFAFARTKAFPKVFIHISRIPSHLKDGELVGVTVNIIVECKDEKITAVYIE